MKIKPNEGKVDRIIRLVIGIVGFGVVMTGAVSGTLATVIGIFSIAMVITAITGFCGLYTLFGLSSCPIRKK
jgi:hypothetical protein